MKIRHLLSIIVVFGLNSALCALTKEEIEKIKAKYGLTTSSKDIAPVKQTGSDSMAGDLAVTPLKKETAQLGKTLQEKSEDIAVEKLDTVINSSKDNQELEGLKDEVKVAQQDPEKAAKSPGFFKTIFGLPKLWSRIATFNKTASENIKRFRVTLKTVGESLASLNEDSILMPKKKSDGTFVTDKDMAIVWHKVSNKKVTTNDIDQLKKECQYIVIKEMVDGFKHLQPVVGPVLDSFYYLTPKLASQSKLIYDVASEFLPMLENFSKENLVKD